MGETQDSDVAQRGICRTHLLQHYLLASISLRVIHERDIGNVSYGHDRKFMCFTWPVVSLVYVIYLTPSRWVNMHQFYPGARR